MMMRSLVMSSACWCAAVSTWAQAPSDESRYAPQDMVPMSQPAMPVPHLVLQSPAAPGYHHQTSPPGIGHQADMVHAHAGPAYVGQAPVAGHFPHNAMVAGGAASQPPHAAQTTHEAVSPIEKIGEHFLHADKRTPQPAIPNAVRVPVWKTPYSYGYFGASRTRHWSRHHGHQQGYTQWSLK